MCKNSRTVRRSVLSIISIVLVSFFSAAQTIPYNGKELYLNGPNVAWNNYGWDFGDNPQGWGGGNGYSSTWWENHFTQLESYGANSARIWVHCKGESNPLFDANSNCTGLNNNFLNNIDDLLDRAKNHHLMVLICLWDFQIVDYTSRKTILTDTNKTRAYINNALIPMVQRYKKQCNLLGFEIFNEPEWIMSGVPGAGNHGSSLVSIAQMQRFVGACAEAVHQHSGKYVTVGSASLKWNSDIAPASRNYWDNNRLYAAYPSRLSYLDFYEVHYYDWMYSGFCPYNRSAGFWKLDKPVLIGESGNTGHFSYQQQFDLGASNGFAGTMIWASSPNTGGAATFAQFNNAMKTFRDNHTTLVNFNCSSLPVQLIHFSVLDSVDVVKIRWAAQNESNHDHYFIQRKTSTDTTDLVSIKLDSTDGQGVKYYSLNDTLAAPGIYSYRLVEVELSSAAHSFLWYKVGVQTELYTSLLLPERSSENVLEKILQSGNYNFRILDLQGREIGAKKSSERNYKTLVNQFSVQSGIYMMEWRNETDLYRMKVFME